MFFVVISMDTAFCPGDDDDADDAEDEDGEGSEAIPSCGDYVMHYLSLFWKLLFATVPPTGKLVNETGTEFISSCFNWSLILRTDLFIIYNPIGSTK